MNRLFLCISAFALIASASLLVAASQADQYYDAGRWLYIAGDMAGAEKNLNQALALEPTHENAKALLDKLKNSLATNEIKKNTEQINVSNTLNSTNANESSNSAPKALVASPTNQNTNTLVVTNLSSAIELSEDLSNSLNASTSNQKLEKETQNSNQTISSLKVMTLPKEFIAATTLNLSESLRRESYRILNEKLNGELSNITFEIIRSPTLLLWVQEQVTPIAEKLVFDQMMKAFLDMRQAYGFTNVDIQTPSFTNRLQEAIRQSLKTNYPVPGDNLVLSKTNKIAEEKISVTNQEKMTNTTSSQPTSVGTDTPPTKETPAKSQPKESTKPETETPSKSESKSEHYIF